MPAAVCSRRAARPGSIRARDTEVGGLQVARTSGWHLATPAVTLADTITLNASPGPTGQGATSRANGPATMRGGTPGRGSRLPVPVPAASGAGSLPPAEPAAAPPSTTNLERRGRPRRSPLAADRDFKLKFKLPSKPPGLACPGLDPFIIIIIIGPGLAWPHWQPEGDAFATGSGDTAGKEVCQCLVCTSSAWMHWHKDCRIAPRERETPGRVALHGHVGQGQQRGLRVGERTPEDRDPDPMAA